MELFNSQYLQKQGSSSKAILASAQASWKLSVPVEEVESTVFGLLNPELHTSVKVIDFALSFAPFSSILLQDGLSALHFLTSIKSSRREEFRIHCDKKFTLSTMFKTAEELSSLQASQNGSASAEVKEELNI